MSDKLISQVMEDQSGALWVGTFADGLTRLDREGRVLETFRHDARQPTTLASDEVRAILEDHAGRLWVGTAEGLDVLDRSTGELSHYRNESADPESLRDSFIMSLYQDDTGLVWIGTRNGGVSRSTHGLRLQRRWSSRPRRTTTPWWGSRYPAKSWKTVPGTRSSRPLCPTASAALPTVTSPDGISGDRADFHAPVGHPALSRLVHRRLHRPGGAPPSPERVALRRGARAFRFAGRCG